MLLHLSRAVARQPTSSRAFSSSSIKFRKDRVPRSSSSSVPATTQPAEAPLAYAPQQQQQQFAEPSAFAQIGSMFALGFGMFVGIAIVRYVFVGFPKREQ